LTSDNQFGARRELYSIQGNKLNHDSKYWFQPVEKRIAGDLPGSHDTLENPMVVSPSTAFEPCLRIEE
jgi:hypothetical protein